MPERDPIPIEAVPVMQTETVVPDAVKRDVHSTSRSSTDEDDHETSSAPVRDSFTVMRGNHHSTCDAKGRHRRHALMSDITSIRIPTYLLCFIKANT